MGRKQYAALQRIENGHKITRETDREFWYNLENALLLALLEDGTLTQMQYRQASEKLKRQRRNDNKSKDCTAPKGSHYTGELAKIFDF